MKLPQSTKAASWSAIGGVIVGMAVMSYGFGYMSPSAAGKIAKAEADTAVVAVLAPDVQSSSAHYPTMLRNAWR